MIYPGISWYIQIDQIDIKRSAVHFMTAKLQHTSNRLTNDGGPAKHKFVQAPVLEASASEQFMIMYAEGLR